MQAIECRGGSTGGRGAAPNEKCAPSAPHFGPASLDFHLNRPVISLIQLQNTVISLIQLHIVAPPLAVGLHSAQNNSDNLPRYPSDSHHRTGDVVEYWREREA